MQRWAWWGVVLGATGFAAGAAGAPAAYWADSWRGWHFYEVPGVAPTPRPAASAAGLAPPSHQPPELLAFHQLKRTLEDYKNIAIMRPTEPNVRRYMTLEAQVTARASAFADMAQRIAWRTPALDPTLQGRPVNAQALEVFEQLQQRDRVQQVAALAPDHVLLFFYRSDCPYCHAFAPTLLALQQRVGLRVEAVSLDGGALPGFARYRPDNGTARALGVSQVPAVFLAQPFTGRITPIGFGVLSQSQLLERLTRAASPTHVAQLRTSP